MRNIKKEGLIIAAGAQCARDKKNEDVNHLFIHCDFTTQVQHSQHSGDQLEMPKTTKELPKVYY